MSKDVCGDCPNRGTMWVKKNGNITIACHFDKRRIKIAGFKFKADERVMFRDDQID